MPSPEISIPPVTLANILCYIFGMVNHFVLEFRGTVFVPSDIASAKTGMSVAGGYAITPDNQVVLATALFVLLLVVAHKMRMENPAKILVRSVRIGGAAVALVFCGLLYNTDWFADHGMKPDFFNQTRGYTNHGSLFHFWINTKYLSVQEPKDYSAEKRPAALWKRCCPQWTLWAKYRWARKADRCPISSAL